MENKNKVILTGTIITNYEATENVRNVMLSTNVNGRVSFPHITFFGAENAQKIDALIAEKGLKKTKVTIECMEQTGKFKKGEEFLHYNKKVGQSIKLATSEVDGIEVPMSDDNKSIFAGKIVNIFKLPNMEDGVIVTLMTNTGKVNFPQVTCFNEQGKAILENAEKGDEVCIIGSASTKKKETKSEKAKFYENYVASEVTFAE